MNPSKPNKDRKAGPHAPGTGKLGPLDETAVDPVQGTGAGKTPIHPGHADKTSSDEAASALPREAEFARGRKPQAGRARAAESAWPLGRAPEPTPETPSGPTPPTHPPRHKRAEKSLARREAIVAAALDEFTERGFAATRMEDVARRAGVGKGTIYLHFKDKEALFQQLVVTMLGPIVAQLKELPQHDEPARLVVERLFALFAEELYGTKRREVMRLVMTEGPRFPQLADFYYHHVVEPASAALRSVLDRALDRGELSREQFAKFPLLVIAPGLVSIIWSSLFDRFAPLDMVALIRAHLDVLFGPGEAL